MLAERKDITKAAQILDQLEPGWELRVDLERLDMMSGNCCVLSKVYRHSALAGQNGYDVGIARLRYHPEMTDIEYLSDRWPFRANVNKCWWVEEIAQRLMKENSNANEAREGEAGRPARQG